MVITNQISYFTLPLCKMSASAHVVQFFCVLAILSAVAGLTFSHPSVRRTCGTETSANETSFMNPEYPASESAAVSNCEFTVLPMTENICQIRLDFDEFTLAQPNSEGQCSDDFMVVSGGYSNVPVVCGDNTGQHMYEEVDPSSSVKLKLNIDVSVPGAKWNIRVTQIECNSQYKAPMGCLQYYTETSGRVRSFNYNSSTSTPTAARQLGDQEYSICIESHPGYCGLTWEQPADEGDYPFSVTGDTTVIPPGSSGVEYSVSGDQCQTDYVIIPSGVFTDFEGLERTSDRYCGSGFPASVESTISPYTFYVVFDSGEEEDRDYLNQGFSLAYRMEACVE